MQRVGSYSDTCSVDSQFSQDEELTFLESCMDCDEDALYDLIQEGLTTWEQVNEKDKSGRTGLSHACGNGFMPILELLHDVEEVDPNMADNDGNTPLIFAAQAGHSDVVSYLLHNFRRLRIDHTNNLGFSALMKAAIQGRTKCAKLLLFAGANPNRRDNGRGLCAEEWAKFCGRINCADAISKYIHSKKYFFKKTFLMTRERWNSEPDLKTRMDPALQKEKGNWIQRHLSFKKKKRGGSHGLSRGHVGNEQLDGEDSPKSPIPLEKDQRTSSSPLLSEDACPPVEDTLSAAQQVMRRPSCVDGVVAVTIVPQLKRAPLGRANMRKNIRTLCEEPPDLEPPTILATDYDLEKQEHVSRL